MHRTYAFFIVLIIPIENLSFTQKVVLGLTLWMSSWWISESIPIYITALLPLVFLPFFQVIPIEEISGAYADGIIFLFLGGFILSKAIEKVNLHKRFAINILNIVGTNPKYIAGAFMIVTAILSGWISNTATAMLMLPIASAVIGQIHNKALQQRFGVVLMLSVAYSASIGGMATLIGTPPNAIFASLSESLVSTDVSFGKWMLIGFPISIATLAISWFYLVTFASKLSKSSIIQEKSIIKKKLAEIGNMTKDEKIVAIVFIGTAILWITRGLLWKDLLPMVDDPSIAVAAAILLFIIPSSKGLDCNTNNQKDLEK